MRSHSKSVFPTAINFPKHSSSFSRFRPAPAERNPEHRKLHALRCSLMSSILFSEIVKSLTSYFEYKLNLRIFFCVVRKINNAKVRKSILNFACSLADIANMRMICICGNNPSSVTTPTIAFWGLRLKSLNNLFLDLFCFV